MNSRQFCFFLDGLLKGVAPDDGMNAHQLGVLRDNLNSVFLHEIDPSMGTPEHQRELDDIHTPPQFRPDNLLLKC